MCRASRSAEGPRASDRPHRSIPSPARRRRARAVGSDASAHRSSSVVAQREKRARRRELMSATSASPAPPPRCMHQWGIERSGSPLIIRVRFLLPRSQHHRVVVASSTSSSAVDHPLHPLPLPLPSTATQSQQQQQKAGPPYPTRPLPHSRATDPRHSRSGTLRERGSEEGVPPQCQPSVGQPHQHPQPDPLLILFLLSVSCSCSFSESPI